MNPNAAGGLVVALTAAVLFGTAAFVPDAVGVSFPEAARAAATTAAAAALIAVRNRVDASDGLDASGEDGHARRTDR